MIGKTEILVVMSLLGFGYSESKDLVLKFKVAEKLKWCKGLPKFWSNK